MGDVVCMPGVRIERSSSSELQTPAISDLDLRRIDRDYRYFGAMTARARNTERLAAVIGKALKLPPAKCRHAASAIALYVTIGKERA